MASYYKIFLNNGYKTSDPRLVDLAGQLGAEPIRIWEDREYWGEANAMHYLIQRINKEFFYCSVLGRIRRTSAITPRITSSGSTGWRTPICPAIATIRRSRGAVDRSIRLY